MAIQLTVGARIYRPARLVSAGAPEELRRKHLLAAGRVLEEAHASRRR